MNEIITKDEVSIENLIYEVRGKQVMLDSDLAKLYGIETKSLKRQVNRNIERFPNDFYFELTRNEYYEILRCQNGTLELNHNKYSKYLPYVFTEQGVSMLSSVLRSNTAINMNIKIIRTFVIMRHYISSNLVSQNFINQQVIKITKIIEKNSNEIKLLQESFSKFEEKRKVNEIYFNGQIYDAYSKIYEIFNLEKIN